MLGALQLTKPSDLLGKLRHEIGRLTEDPYDSYAALNAARDAYHLCDWVWGACLSTNAALQQTIMGARGEKRDFVKWVKLQYPPIE